MLTHIKTTSVVLVLITTTLSASVIQVPGDQPTIQAAIDSAFNHDTVLVAPGTYQENIHFREKDIVVASFYITDPNPLFVEQTIIDGSSPMNPDTGTCVLIVSDSASTTADTMAAGTGCFAPLPASR